MQYNLPGALKGFRYLKIAEPRDVSAILHTKVVDEMFASHPASRALKGFELSNFG